MIENRSSLTVLAEVLINVLLALEAGNQVASVYAALHLLWLFALVARFALLQHSRVCTHLS